MKIIRKITIIYLAGIIILLAGLILTTIPARAGNVRLA